MRQHIHRLIPPTATWILWAIFFSLLCPGLQIHALEDDDDREEAEEQRIFLLERIAEAHFERATLLGEQARLDDAIRELEKIRELPFPKGEDQEEQLFGVDIALIELFLEAERPKDAEPLLRKAIQRSIDMPDRLAQLHIFMGHAMNAQDRTEDALRHYNLAIEAGRLALEEEEDPD